VNVRWVFLGAVAACVVLLDQASKALVTANLLPYESWAPVESLDHLFNITYVTNTGAVFGLFKDRGAFFLLLAIAVTVGIIYYYRHLEPEEDSWLVRLAFGLMLGGAVGNLIDRVRVGHVIDFIHFSFWAVFNVADSCIVGGVFLMVVVLLWGERKGNKETSARAP
jgi:signal peptidase II